MAKKNKQDEQDNGPDESGQQPAYNPFLKAADVSEDGERFGIAPGFTRRKPGMYGEQIVMELARERDDKIFDFGIGVGSVNHRILAKRKGAESGWSGAIVLRAETMTRGRGKGNKMIVVVDEDPNS